MKREKPEHLLVVHHKGVGPNEKLPISLIKHVIRTTLKHEGVNMQCEIGVRIVNDIMMRERNREYRGVDKTTDVLSFPLYEFSKPGWGGLLREEICSGEEVLPLGDIVMSAEQIIRQASENNQTYEYETAYITSHSVLHLLGYDHVDEGEDKKLMRKKEKEIMQKIGL